MYLWDNELTFIVQCNVQILMDIKKIEKQKNKKKTSYIH